MGSRAARDHLRCNDEGLAVNDLTSRQLFRQNLSRPLNCFLFRLLNLVESNSLWIVLEQSILTHVEIKKWHVQHLNRTEVL